MLSGDDDKPPVTTTTVWYRPTRSSSRLALQQAQGCDKPVLIRIDTNAGHGAGSRPPNASPRRPISCRSSSGIPTPTIGR